jgi:hypothetical protein
MMQNMRLFAVGLLAIALIGCGGLDPTIEPSFSGIRGSIRFVGGTSRWPADSIYDLRVVAFEEQPTVPADIIASLIRQRAAFTPAMLPVRVDSASFEIEVLAPPRSFPYVVVAMQVGPNFQQDWLMLDVYAPSGDKTIPGTVRVPSGGVVGVNFSVDFDNLPPQPFN